MPIHTLRNQYRGINAHLHSFWQATGTWNRFHNAYITHLSEALRMQLLPMGYIVEMEESLQIRRFGLDLPDTRSPHSDTILYDPNRERAATLPSAGAESVLTVAELIEEEDAEHPYFAVTIHPVSPDLEMEDAIVWIELLSPTNKGKRSDAETYLGKRRALLDSGLVFVEIDYLHATPPTFPRLSDYTRHEPDAHPYRIVVLDPRPNVQTGPAELYEFDVDTPIPDVILPLSADDAVKMDLDTLYQDMIARGYAYYSVDYAQLPMEFERYTPADQTRIVRRMLAIMEAVRDGLDLATIAAPLDVKDMPLDKALEAVRQWQIS